MGSQWPIPDLDFSGISEAYFRQLVHFCEVGSSYTILGDVFIKSPLEVQYFLYRDLDLCIPRKGIAQPQFQFPHSCVCERSVYSHVWPTYFPAAEQADRSEENINRPQKHYNWDCSRAVPFLGIFASNFRYCVFAVCINNTYLYKSSTDGGGKKGLRHTGSGLNWSGGSIPLRVRICSII